MMNGSALGTQATAARRLAIALLLLSAPAGAAVAATLDGQAVRLPDTFAHADQVSGAQTLGRFLFLAPDEGRWIQVLESVEEGYRLAGEPIAVLDDNVEADLEALAAEGATLYAVGSHSLKRKRLRPDPHGAKDRQRLQRVEREASRYFLYRMNIDPQTGHAAAIERASLSGLLERDPYLARFSEIPGKENGVDVEALAVRDGRLFAGLRSPVLRGGLAPVIVLDFDAPREYELRFVDTGGRGIRAMATVQTGFLLILAAERGEPGSSELCHWDGSDLFAPRRGAARLRCLGRIPAVSGGTPEGLALLAEEAQRYRLLVTFDGVPGGGPLRLTLPR